jgi:hypothetical protein
VLVYLRGGPYGGRVRAADDDASTPVVIEGPPSVRTHYHRSEPVEIVVVAGQEMPVYVWAPPPLSSADQARKTDA